MRGVMAIMGIVLLAAGALLLAGTGLQIAPTSTSIAVYDNGPAASSSDGVESASWSPSSGGRFSGFSLQMWSKEGLGSESAQLAVSIECGDTALWSASVGRSVTETPTWYTFTSATLINGGGKNVTAGASCAIELSQGNTRFVHGTEGIGAGPTFVVWAVPSSGAGAGQTQSTSADVTSTDDDTPPPPPPPGMNRLVLIGLGVIFLVFGGALVASDAMELLGG